MSVLLLSLGFSSLGWGSSSLDIVVSVEPQRWLVEQIGSSEVAVEVLVESGESPATYRPTDAQVTRLMRSDLYFRIGVPFERGLWFDAVSQMGRFVMVDLRQEIELSEDDPHIWLSPRLLAIQAQTVSRALSQADPDHAADFAANLEALEQRLAELDQQIRRQLGAFSGREFYVFHPSWGYFAADYGVEQVAIEIAGREPSDRESTELQKRARQANTTTVFVQPQIHGRSALAFAEAIGARVEILDPLAADVTANLEATAGKLVQALAEAGGDER